MKKKLLLTTVALLASSALFSQNEIVDIQWGEKVEMPKKHGPVGLVGNPQSGYIQITEIPKKTVGFMSFDKDLKYIEVKTENLPESKYNSFERVLDVNGRSFVLISDFDKETQSEKLYAREIDLDNATFKDEPMLVVETDEKVKGTFVMGGFMFAGSTTKDKFKTVVSQDEKRILVHYQFIPDNKKGSENHDRMGFCLYDNNWTPIWNKEIEMKYAENETDIFHHIILGNDLYFFAMTRDNSDKELMKSDSYDGMSAFRLGENGELEEHEIDFAHDNYFFNVKFGKETKDGILLTGNYKGSRKSKGAVGYFTAIFNPDKLYFEDIVNYPYSEDLITSFEKAGTKRKLEKELAKGNEPGIPHLRMRNIFERPGGGWYTVAEQFYYWYTITPSSRGVLQTTYHIYYQDVIVSAIDKDGQEEFVTKVAKNQHFMSSYGSPIGIAFVEQMAYGFGIKAFMHEDNVYIFNIDLTENDKVSDGEAPKMLMYGTFKNCSFVCTKISNSGDVQRSNLYQIDKDMVPIIPSTLEEVAPGVVLTTASKAPMKIFSRKFSSALLYLK